MRQVQGAARRPVVCQAAVVSADLFGFRAGSFQGQLNRAKGWSNGRSARPGVKLLPAYILEDIGVAEHDYSGEFA